MTIDGYSTTGFSGIQYVGDYSATYTPRSLPDVAWVTGHSLTASNGLTISGTTVYLGGALSQNTTINAFGHAFKICGLNNCDLLTIDDSVGIISLCTGGGAYICLESGDYIGLYASAEGLSINGTGSTKFTSINGTGIVYAGDYSATFCDNSLVSKLYVDNALTGSTSTAGQNITKLICQTSHGFNVGDVLGWSGGTYNKAIASGAYDGEVLGLVSKCYNVDCFDLTQAGYVTGLTGLITSTTYFLSDVTAGLITSIEPTSDQHISKSVMIANSSTSGWIFPYAGYVINTGSTCGTLIKSVCFPSTSTYFMTTNDFFVGAKSGDTIILPSSPQCGMVVVVADTSDHAFAGPISVIGALANGQSQSLINTDSGSLTYIFNGSRWNVIGFVSAAVPF
jgi:hypothetical protein